MKSGLRKWLLALAVVSSCPSVHSASAAADPAEPTAQSRQAQEEPFYLHRREFTIQSSDSRHAIRDSRPSFAVHYSPRTGAFLVTPPNPVSATLTPNDLNQVSTSIFDPVTNAIRVNAMFSAGGSHTPNDANQVFTSIFDATHNAVVVECVVGCSTSILVPTDSPGTAYSGGGTVTFTQGSAAVTTSSGSWNASNVGSIIQYNSGTAPNFRAVVIAVSGSTLTLGAPFPGATTGAVPFNASLVSGTYNSVADVCGQLNASMLNHPGASIDARGITGINLTCTVNPFNGFNSAGGGGELWLGFASFLIQRTWTVPSRFHLRGQGRGYQTGGSQTNTTLRADPTNFTAANYSRVNFASSGVTISSGSATFNDTNGNFQVGISGGVCDGGAFGHATVTSVLRGWVEGQLVTIQGVTGSTGWNGNWTVAAVSGNQIEIGFQSDTNATCPTPGTFTSAVADSASFGLLQGSIPVTVSGTLTSAQVPNSAGVGSGFWQVSDTAADFTSNDVGQCTITSGSNTWTIVDFVDTQHVNIHATSNPSLSGSSFTKTCWVQGVVESTSSATSVTLGQNNLYPISSGTFTYSVNAPVVSTTPNGFQSGGGGHIAYATDIENLGVDCNLIVDCTGIQLVWAQENTRVQWVTVFQGTGVDFDWEYNSGDSGPYEGLELNISGHAPTAIGLLSSGNGSGTHAGILRTTVLGSNNNFAAVEEDGGGLFEGIHVESSVNAFVVGRLATGGVGGRSSVNINNSPGVNIYNDYWLPNNSATDVSIIGNVFSNAAIHDTVEDNSIGPTCAQGGITDYHVQSGTGTLGFYQTSHTNSGYRMRTVSESAGISSGGAMNCTSATYNVGVVQASNQVVKLTGNTSAITTTTLASATPFLSWTAPAGTPANGSGSSFLGASSGAYNWTFDCHGVYSQATAAAANLWGISVTGGSLSRIDANSVVFTSLAGAQTSGAAYNYSTLTTPVQTVTAMPSAAGSVGTVADMFPFHFWGVLQQANGSTPPTLNLLVASGSASDAITVYAGSMCTIW